MMFSKDKSQTDDELDVISLMLRSGIQVARIFMIFVKLSKSAHDRRAIEEIDLDEVIDEPLGACESATEGFPHKKLQNGEKSPAKKRDSVELQLSESFSTSTLMI